MLNVYAWLQTRLYQMTERMEDEGGLETVEYIAMVFVALVLLLAIATVFSKDETVATAALAKLVEFITNLGAGG
jgi:hypothetical protein